MGKHCPQERFCPDRNVASCVPNGRDQNSSPILIICTHNPPRLFEVDYCRQRQRLGARTLFITSVHALVSEPKLGRRSTAAKVQLHLIEPNGTLVK